MQADFLHFTELLMGMLEKEIRSRYKFTIFGFLWLIVNPILQMLIIGYLFKFFMNDPINNYYYHLFIGLLVWNFFSMSMTKATASIVNERSLIKKATFPHAIIPMSIILSNTINLIIALLLLCIPIAFLQTFSAFSFLYIFSGVALLLLFTTGLSLLTSALNVRFRDVNFLVQALLLVWFYASPIIYSLSQMPDTLLWIWRINPLTSVLQLLHHAFLGSPGPDLTVLVENVCIVAFVTAIGVWIFRKESKTFDDWI